MNERRGGPGVVAEGLSVVFGSTRGKGLHVGLDGFGAAFGPGITGLVGPNGAGKSTFLRTVCGLLRPASGSISVGGRPPVAHISSMGIGFLPENPALPNYLTVGEFLSGLAQGDSIPVDEDGSIHGVPGVEGLLEKMICTLSLGQAKKVALVAALSRCPSLLLLDEPTNGLDPLAMRDIRVALKEKGRVGTTVIISSHHLDELQRIADRLVFMNKGKLVGEWTQKEAIEEFQSFDSLFDAVLGGRTT